MLAAHIVSALGAPLPVPDRFDKDLVDIHAMPRTGFKLARIHLPETIAHKLFHEARSVCALADLLATLHEQGDIEPEALPDNIADPIALAFDFPDAAPILVSNDHPVRQGRAVHRYRPMKRLNRYEPVAHLRHMLDIALGRKSYLSQAVPIVLVGHGHAIPEVFRL